MTTLVGSSREHPRTTPDRTAVPWLTVASLAVLLAYTQGFWVVSLRGSVGAVERTEAPFTSWLLESTLLLPVFVFAVLGGLTLALRWFGPVPRHRRAVVGTLLLVVAAGTLAGIAGLAASAAYDYHLQSSQLAMMDAMLGACPESCRAQQLQATLGLQLRAVGYGSAILLASNLVVVFWATALRGGRVDISTTRRGSSHRIRVGDLRLLLAAGLVASGIIHAAVVPEHLDEWMAAGLFFIVLTTAQLVVASVVLVRPSRVVLQAAVLVSAVPQALWLCSRTLGLPFGPEVGVPEPFGLADGASVVLEVGALAVAVVLIRARGRLRRRSVSEHVGWLGLVAVVAVTALGLAGTGLPLFDGLVAPADQKMSEGPSH